MNKFEEICIRLLEYWKLNVINNGNWIAFLENFQCYWQLKILEIFPSRFF